MGNVVANTASAVIASGAVVTSAGNIELLASDTNPNLLDSSGGLDALTGYILGDEQKGALDDALTGSPIDPNVNILSLMVSVSGSGGVAVNGAFTGNVISNTVTTSINNSTVTSTGGDIHLISDSRAGILALTVGVAGSGGGAIDISGFGNVIENDVVSAITSGSSVTTDTGSITLDADDVSLIRSAGISVAGSGAISCSK